MEVYDGITSCSFWKIIHSPLKCPFSLHLQHFSHFVQGLSPQYWSMCPRDILWTFIFISIKSFNFSSAKEETWLSHVCDFLIRGFSLSLLSQKPSEGIRVSFIYGWVVICEPPQGIRMHPPNQPP